MNWTSNLPTDAGFYWYRESISHLSAADPPITNLAPATIIEVQANSRVLFMDGDGTMALVHELMGEFYGPLIPPL